MRDNRTDFYQKKNSDIIFGVRTVIEAINSNREINKILIQKGINKELFLELKEILKGKDYNLQFVPHQKLDNITKGLHQGVIAFVSPVQYFDIEQIAEEKIQKGEKIFILVLDRITDVRNFGGIARTAECHGVDAILIPSKGSALVTSDAVKTSSGALNKIKICKTDNLKNSLFYLKQLGISIISCTEKSKNILYKTDLSGSVAIILGSEENGITNDLINLSNQTTKIPLYGSISSLNVGVAAGIILYEKTKQDFENKI
jgi:23S rRNA (guanosine2251-2'-O)-methyltransferase